VKKLATATEYEVLYARKRVICDPESVPFVAKVQKAKTRKNKDYFVLRTTIPKEVSVKIGVEAGDYLFFRAKKAQWYHMLDWKKMSNTWKMLPDEIRNRITMDGICSQPILDETKSLGTNLAGQPALAQMVDQENQRGGTALWK
jgi:hypothetical protein